MVDQPIREINNQAMPVRLFIDQREEIERLTIAETTHLNSVVKISTLFREVIDLGIEQKRKMNTQRNLENYKAQV